MNTASYRHIHNSFFVSPICLGTMNFGADARGTNEEEAHTILDQFVELGGNFIDTADVYNGGRSEEIVGSWIAKHPEARSKIVLASKVFFQGGRPNPNDAGLSRSHIVNTLETTLRRLSTDYLDIYQIHNWDSRVDVQEWIRTFADLIVAGKIRHYGVCNVTGWQLQKIVSTADAMNLPRPVRFLNQKSFFFSFFFFLPCEELRTHTASLPRFFSLNSCSFRLTFLTQVVCQMQYNLLSREVEWEVLHCCAANGISFLPWSPLKGGWLTGKFQRDAAPDPDTRIGAVSAGQQKQLQSHPGYDQFNNETTWNLLDIMQEIAAAEDCTVAQIACRWLLGRPQVI